jgi:hypothetical protein
MLDCFALAGACPASHFIVRRPGASGGFHQFIGNGNCQFCPDIIGPLQFEQFFRRSRKAFLRIVRIILRFRIRWRIRGVDAFAAGNFLP